jgi:multiple sugar transport system substrate-binding protein
MRNCRAGFTLALVLLVAPALSVAAAGSAETTAAVKLTIAGRDGSYGDAMQYAADEYTKQHPNVTFDVLKLPYDTQYQKVVIDMRSGTGTYDLIMIDDPNAPQFQKAGWLADLGALLSAKNMKLDPDIIDTTVRLGRYPYSDSGTLYALPHVGNVEMFAYRNDLFDRYGLPKPETWDSVLAAAQKLSQADKNVTPVVFRGVKGNPIVSGFLPIYWAYGASILDGDKAVLDSPQALAALQYFLKLKPYAPQGVDTWNSAQVRDALYGGRAAIATEVWPSWVGDLDNPEKSQVAGKVTITAHPREVDKSSPLLGAWLLGIPKASKHQDAALSYLLYVTGKDMQIQLADRFGIAPSRASVLEDPALLKKYPWFPGQEQALRNARARPRTNKWPEIESNFGTYLQLALIGSSSPADALKGANGKVQEIMQQ